MGKITKTLDIFEAAALCHTTTIKFVSFLAERTCSNVSSHKIIQVLFVLPSPSRLPPEYLNYSFNWVNTGKGQVVQLTHIRTHKRAKQSVAQTRRHLPQMEPKRLLLLQLSKQPSASPTISVIIYKINYAEIYSCTFLTALPAARKGKHRERQRHAADWTRRHTHTHEASV